MSWGCYEDSIDAFGGSQRTAMAAHLGINGYWLRTDPLAAYRFMMELNESGRFRMAELEPWLRARVLTER